MLRGEAGLHRLRLPPPEGVREAQGKVVVAAVRVGAWTGARGAPVLVRQRPLKAVGQLGGKVRSRVECELGPVASGAPGILVLQSGRTIAENTDLAGEVAPSWAMTRMPPEEVVRRYDRAPPLVRDSLAGVSSGRPDALSPRSFDAMLKARVDAAPPMSLR
jgi:hypothetical protein